ncbi:helix-turn-helix domain-containing protein [Albibacterium profundi]|uniref:Helix-turn-helix domain-containing protein n=1 Tax=Albibacterium profundi TaxID=3134906 RepID=A0ABV5CBJ8_9SPHI
MEALFIGENVAVDERLKNVISRFYYVDAHEIDNSVSYHYPPSLEMMIIFSFGSPIHCSFGESEILDHSLEKIAVIGPLRKIMNYEIAVGSEFLVLPFIYDGFYRFFSLSIEGMSEGKLSEKEVATYNSTLEKIWKALSELSTNKERVDWMSNYLITHLNPSSTGALPLLDAIPSLDTAFNPVKVIAHDHAVSERTIQKRFRKYTGYSPKELMRFLRFKQVITYISGKELKEVDWFDVIYKFGYHDQSHLNKDFKYYTGTSPAKFAGLNLQRNFCFHPEGR